MFSRSPNSSKKKKEIKKEKTLLVTGYHDRANVINDAKLDVKAKRTTTSKIKHKKNTFSGRIWHDLLLGCTVLNFSVIHVK